MANQREDCVPDLEHEVKEHRKPEEIILVNSGFKPLSIRKR